MTVVNLLENLKSMLEKNFKDREIRSKNNTANGDFWDLYSYPNIFIGFRPVTMNNLDFPAIVIIPPTNAKESQKERSYDITFICSIKHNLKAVDNNACLEAVSFTEIVKDIIFKNRIVGDFALDFTQVEWGVDILMNSPDISVAEITTSYKSINNYT